MSLAGSSQVRGRQGDSPFAHALRHGCPQKSRSPLGTVSQNNVNRGKHISFNPGQVGDRLFARSDAWPHDLLQVPGRGLLIIPSRHYTPLPPFPFSRTQPPPEFALLTIASEVSGAAAPVDDREHRCATSGHVSLPRGQTLCGATYCFRGQKRPRCSGLITEPSKVRGSCCRAANHSFHTRSQHPQKLSQIRQ